MSVLNPLEPSSEEPAESRREQRQRPPAAAARPATRLGGKTVKPGRAPRPPRPAREKKPFRLPTVHLPALPAFAPPRLDLDRLRRALWNVVLALSLIVNVVLLAALLLVSRLGPYARDTISRRILFEGLYVPFAKLDQAHIRATIPITHDVHITLPVRQTTVVTLTENTLLRNARVSILNTPADITLPAGTRLPIQLDMVIEATVPISMTVPVDIPLAETELHEPFSDLQRTFRPLIALLYPADWSQTGLCRVWRGLCEWWYYP